MEGYTQDSIIFVFLWLKTSQNKPIQSLYIDSIYIGINCKIVSSEIVNIIIYQRSVTAKSASSINCAKGSYNAFSSRSDVVDKKLCLKVVQTTIRFPAEESGMHHSMAVWW